LENLALHPLEKDIVSVFAKESLSQRNLLDIEEQSDMRENSTRGAWMGNALL